MNVILKINHQEFLLPNTAGVENLMRVMAKAVSVYDRTWATDDPRIEVNLDPIKVEMKFAPAGARYVQERTNQPVDVWSDLPTNTGLIVTRRKALAGQKMLKS